MKTERCRFFLDRADAPSVLMALAIVFRVIGCWGLWNDREYLIWQIALPIGAAVVFILLLLTLGRPALWASSLPVLAGAVFFIVRAMERGSTLETVIFILLPIVVAVIYTLTVFNAIKTRWFLVLLTLAPLAYHLFVVDLEAMRNVAEPVSFAAGMQEMSVLCVLFALLYTSLAMKNRRKVKVEEPAAEAAAEPAEGAQAENGELPAQEQPAAESGAAPETEAADAPAEEPVPAASPELPSQAAAQEEIPAPALPAEEENAPEAAEAGAEESAPEAAEAGAEEPALDAAPEQSAPQAEESAPKKGWSLFRKKEKKPSEQEEK